MLGDKINVTYPLPGDNLNVNLEDGTTVVYNLGDMAWVIGATALVWVMIPGIGFFYSGLLRRKNAASMLWQSLTVLSTVSFQVHPVPKDHSASNLMRFAIASSGSFGVIL